MLGQDWKKWIWLSGEWDEIEFNFLRKRILQEEAKILKKF